MSNVTKPVSSALCILLLAIDISPALAGARSIPCVDNLAPQSDVDHIRSIRNDLDDSREFRKSRKAAAKAVEDALALVMKDADIDASVRAGIQDVRVLIDNAIFDEALARAMKTAGFRDGETIEAFQKKLANVTPEQQTQFGAMVVRHYRKLMDDAFEWLDSERFEKIAKRWNLTEESAFDLLTRWKLIENTDSAELHLAAMVWSKTVAADTIAETMDSMKRIPGAQNITDLEEVMVTRIRAPYSDAQLARNQGPFSDAEFARKLRYWSAVGWLRRRLHALRNPKDSAFLTFMGGGTLVALAALSKNAGVMLSMGTAATALIGMAPLVEHLTKGVSRLQRTSTYLEIFTLGQLGDLRRWVKKNPHKSTEVGFQDLLPAIDERIAALRALRYVRPALPK